VISKGGGSGTINSVTLMDYTSGEPKEIPATVANKTIVSGVNTISIPWTGSVSGLVREAAARSQGGFACYAEPAAARRGGEPVRIHLAGPAASRARLIVRDARGQVIRSSGSALDAAPGHAEVTWDLCDGRGRAAPPGLYYASVMLEDGDKLVKSGTARIAVTD
jgi:hypothetical protein